VPPLVRLVPQVRVLLLDANLGEGSARAVPEGTRVSSLRLPSAEALGYHLSSRKAGLRFIAVTADQRELSLGSQIHLETKIPTLAKGRLGWATRILQWLPSFWGMRFLLIPFIPAT
jgi:hypothetical protein